MKNKCYSFFLALSAFCLLLAVSLIGISGCSTPTSPPGVLSDPGAPVGLTAAMSGKRVLLNWQGAPGLYDFYRLYRTTSVDSLGNVDTSSMEAIGARNNIRKSTTSFLDVPGVEMVPYYYSLRAVQVRRSFFTSDNDTIEGPLSNISEIKVGTQVRFDILRNAEFAETRACTLFVYDPDRALTSVRFTNVVAADSGSGYRPVAPRGPGQGQNDPTTIAGRFAAMISTGVFSLERKTDTARTVPYFGAAGDEPEPVPYALGAADVNPIPWTLTRGGGEKRVYAEVRYANGDLDTIVDIIKPKPHKIELVIRNSKETRDVRDTTLILTGRGVKKFLILNGDNLQYSVKTFGDELIDTVFYSWMAFSNLYANIDAAKSTNYMDWYYTNPLKVWLGEIGDKRNSDTVYQFPFALEQPGAREVFGTLAGASVDNYKPALLKESNGDESALRSHITLFDNLNEFDRKAIGTKGFLLFLRFVEKGFSGELVFEDELVYVLGLQAGADTFWTRRDIYFPTAKFQTNKDFNPDHISNGDTIITKFNFALDTASLFDEGFARIDTVALIIAKKPAVIDWNNANVRSSITLETMRTWPHNTYQYTVEIPHYGVKYARWDNLDPSDWTAGDYLMGVVVSDEYGREGLAKVADDKVQPNPWLVYFKTSN